MLRYPFPSSALQPARPCIGLMGPSHPENHEASFPDPVERLAPRSQYSVKSGYKRIFYECKALWVHRSWPADVAESGQHYRCAR